MTQLVDQLAAEPLAAPTAGAVLPSAPRRQRQRRHLAVRRKVVIALLTVGGILLCLLAYDRLVTRLMHDQRQRHLASHIGAGMAQIHSGQPFGYIQIPSLGVNEIVIEGVTDTTLRSGPAITRDSVLPGQQGATVIFGHRSSYSGPFKHLPNIKKGDSVFVQARNKAPVIEYTVDGVEVQRPGAPQQLPAGAAGSSTLVLVTSTDDSLSDATIIVTATAPASVAGGPAAVTDISLATDDDKSPIGLDLLLANLSLGMVALVWKLMRTRGKSSMAYIVCAPVVAVAVVWLAQFAESLLPLTR